MQTKYGAIQFGVPPETIKDSLMLGLEVPGFYVLPKDRFNLKFGTNVSEIEFPAYYNFFLKGRSTTIICTQDAASECDMHQVKGLAHLRRLRLL